MPDESFSEWLWDNHYPAPEPCEDCDTLLTDWDIVFADHSAQEWTVTWEATCPHCGEDTLVTAEDSLY